MPDEISIDAASEHRRRVQEVLIAAGLSVPMSVQPAPSSPLSPERREELAHSFSTERPLSELIIEERQTR